jgi:hypothetical protein
MAVNKWREFMKKRMPGETLKDLAKRYKGSGGKCATSEVCRVGKTCDTESKRCRNKQKTGPKMSAAGKKYLSYLDSIPAKKSASAPKKSASRK